MAEWLAGPNSFGGVGASKGAAKPPRRPRTTCNKSKALVFLEENMKIASMFSHIACRSQSCLGDRLLIPTRRVLMRDSP